MAGRVKSGYANRSVRSSKKLFKRAKIAAGEVKLLNSRVPIVQVVVKNSNQYAPLHRSGGCRGRYSDAHARKGEPAPQGVGEPGDLFIELEIEEHVWFERSGSDLIMSLPLGYADLVLGTTVELDILTESH